MDIVILSHFCMDFSKSDNDRFLYLAHMLIQRDHEVEIITSNFYHTKKQHRNQPADAQPMKITFLPEPGYPKNVCLRRFYSHYVWGKQVKQYLAGRKKPDVIYCAVPSLTGPNEAAKYCRQNHIYFVIDVQDLWPEAFQMIFHLPVISKIVFYPFQRLADSIYRSANAICAVSETYVNRALRVNRTCQTGTAVFLGTNLDTFDQNAQKNPILKKNEREIWLAYCGTLGSSYDLICVFDALDRLKQAHLTPKLIVMGDGPKQREFEAYAREKALDVKFTGRLSYDQMCALLHICDITVNPIAHGAAGSIINKHADYAASGLPVVSTQENDEYRNLVEQYQMGLNCQNHNVSDLAEKLKKLMLDPTLRKSMGQHARQCAEEKFDRKKTYPYLCQIIEQNRQEG